MDEYLRLTPAPPSAGSGAVSERMQALLSRAVEEQVNEQREVQSLLSEVRNALTQVQRDGRAAPAGQADLGAHLANHASETRTQLTLLDERLEAIVRAVGTSAQVLQGISGQLERLGDAIKEQTANAGRSEPVAQVRREVSDLRSRVDAMESSVRGDVAGLHQQLAADVERITASTDESTRTIANHVDNAVLVLAEALLRRPGVTPSAEVPSGEGVAAAPAFAAAPSEPEPEPEPEQDPEPEAEAVPAVEAAAEPERGLESARRSEPQAGAAVPEEPAAHNVAAEVPADDPLWGSSFRAPAVPVHGEPEPTPEVTPEAFEPNIVDADEAGDLADQGRSGDLPPWSTPVVTMPPAGGGATAYDDPLSDLPGADEPRPALGIPAAAPYSLERALFGDRSRPVNEFAPIPRDDEQPPATEATDDEGDSEPDERPSGGAGAPPEVEEEGSSDEDPDAPRRRPWWRPSS